MRGASKVKEWEIPRVQSESVRGRISEGMREENLLKPGNHTRQKTWPLLTGEVSSRHRERRQYLRLQVHFLTVCEASQYLNISIKIHSWCCDSFEELR